MFIDHPVLGVGPGGFAVNLDRYGAQIPQLSDYLPTPHNAYVQMAAETGVIGLLAFVCFLAAGLFVAIRAARSAPPDVRGLRLSLLWSYATMCAAGLVVWPFAHGTGQAVLVVAAATFAVPREAP
jgi:O-antigen ligase